MTNKCVVTLREARDKSLAIEVIIFDDSWKDWTPDRCMRAIESLINGVADIGLFVGRSMVYFTQELATQEVKMNFNEDLKQHLIPSNIIPGKKSFADWYYPHNVYMTVNNDSLDTIQSFFEHNQVEILDLSSVGNPQLISQFFKIFQAKSSLVIKPRALYLRISEHTKKVVEAFSLQKEALADVQHLAFSQCKFQEDDVDNVQQVVSMVCQRLPDLHTLEMPASRLHVLNASIGEALSLLRVVIANFEIGDIWALRRDVFPDDSQMAYREQCYLRLKTGYAAVHEHLSQAQIMRVVTAEGIPDDLAIIMHQHFNTVTIPGLEIAFSNQCQRYVEEKKTQPKLARGHNISIRMLVKHAMDQKLNWPEYRQQSVDAFEKKAMVQGANAGSPKALLIIALLCFQRKNKDLKVPRTQDASMHILCMCLLSMRTKEHPDKLSNTSGLSSMRLAKAIQVERLVEKPSHVHRLRASAAGGADTGIVPTSHRRWRPRTTTYDPGMRWPVTTTYQGYASDSSSEPEDAGAAASARGCERRFEPR